MSASDAFDADIIQPPAFGHNGAAAVQACVDIPVCLQVSEEITVTLPAGLAGLRVAA